MDGEADSAVARLEQGDRVMAALSYLTRRRGTKAGQQASEFPALDETQRLI
jgi:hypothetical protein